MLTCIFTQLCACLIDLSGLVSFERRQKSTWVLLGLFVDNNQRKEELTVIFENNAIRNILIGISLEMTKVELREAIRWRGSNRALVVEEVPQYVCRNYSCYLHKTEDIFFSVPKAMIFLYIAS